MNLINEVHHMDAFALLSRIEDQSVDLIFTDIPYWTLDKWRNVGTTTRLGGNKDANKQDDSKWFPTISQTELWEVLLEFYRVLKKDRHCFIMCDGQTLKYVLGYVEEAGFNYYKPIVWDKKHQGMGYHLRNRHEYVVMLDKGKNRKPKNLSLPDIVNVHGSLNDWLYRDLCAPDNVTVQMLRGGYPTEKPVELPEFFIEQYSEKGEIVLDPFCGSGSTLVAAVNKGCKFIGGDKVLEAVTLSRSRLEVSQTLLF